MTPNVALLRQTLEYIKAHPQEWDQEFYRCETGMCFAGWAATLAGGVWAGPGDTEMVAEPDDPADRTFDGRIHVADRAERLLGLNAEQVEDLFTPDNDLDDLECYVEKFCAEGGETP